VQDRIEGLGRRDRRSHREHQKNQNDSAHGSPSANRHAHAAREYPRIRILAVPATELRANPPQKLPPAHHDPRRPRPTRPPPSVIRAHAGTLATPGTGARHSPGIVKRWTRAGGEPKISSGASSPEEPMIFPFRFSVVFFLLLLTSHGVACTGTGDDGDTADDDDDDDNDDNDNDDDDDNDNDDDDNDSGCPDGPELNGPYTRVTVAGETSALGIIDPSVEYAAGAGAGLMTYTAVPGVARVKIAIARSVDSGETWRYQSDVAQARTITIATTDNAICGSPSCNGTFVHESSSLVVDSFDPDPNRRLKVFTHSYFFRIERQLQLGYIAMYTAPAPQGPWTETKLFGWTSSSPISTTDVRYNINTDPALPELHECLIVGEPGALVRAPGTIDLALACVMVNSDDTSAIDIRLLRSADHGSTWNFVDTLLTAQDALALGATTTQINGADLFFANDAYHLIATPIGLVDFPEGQEEGYRGCLVVSVADIETGQVARCDGAPTVEAYYLGQPGQFVGACSTDVGASANSMLIPVPNFNSSQPFQLFASRPKSTDVR